MSKKSDKFLWLISRSIKGAVHRDERTMIINVALGMLIYFPLEQYWEAFFPTHLYIYRQTKRKPTKINIRRQMEYCVNCQNSISKIYMNKFPTPLLTMAISPTKLLSSDPVAWQWVTQFQEFSRQKDNQKWQIYKTTYWVDWPFKENLFSVLFYLTETRWSDNQN